MKKITGMNGTERWVCPECSLSFPERLAALACCKDKQHVLEEAVTLEINPAPTPVPDTPEPEMRAMPPVQAPELLGRAAALMHERGKTYDQPEGERSMGKCVAAFNAVTGRDLRESEGWLLLTLLKSVRGFTRSEYHADSFEDLIAYGALMAEARGQGL